MYRVILGGAAAAALVVTSYAVWSFSRPGPLVAMHTPLRHDDFVFSVNAAHSVPFKDANHLLIDVLIVNQAKRVEYEWRNAIAFVEDAGGNRYDAVSDNSFALRPGESRVAAIAFDVPKSVQHPVVRFWDGIYMGDAFDGAKYARARVSIAQ